MMNRRRSAFTLVELMIALAITVVVTFYLMGTFITSQRTYVVVEQVTEAQQNARLVSEFIEREIRNAGYKVPDAAAICGVDRTNDTDVLYVSDVGVIQSMDQLPMNMRGIALGPEVQGVGGATLSGNTTVVLDSLSVDNAGTDFQVNGGVILVDQNDASGNTACGVVTAVNTGASQITFTLANSFGPIPSNADVRAIPAHRYWVDSDDQLTRDGDALIMEVEDFQVAYFFDTNGNDVVDAGEYLADGVGGTDAYSPTTANATQLREVRVNLVVRTSGEDPREEYSEGQGQALENRDVNTVSTSDGYRRRIHTATVRLRNVGS